MRGWEIISGHKEMKMSSDPYGKHLWVEKWFAGWCYFLWEKKILSTGIDFILCISKICFQSFIQGWVSFSVSPEFGLAFILIIAFLLANSLSSVKLFGWFAFLTKVIFKMCNGWTERSQTSFPTLMILWIFYSSTCNLFEMFNHVD